MEFGLTDTQQMLQDTTLRLVREKYSFEQRKAVLAQPDGWSRALWREFADLGLLGIEIAEEHGGIGGTFKDLSVALEAFGRGLVVEPFLSTVVLGAGLIVRAGTPAQQADILPKVVAGEITLALAYAEPDTRYRFDNPGTRARRDGERYVLNGRKAVVLGADSADTLIVSAGTDKGLSLFLVDRRAPGLDIRNYSNIDDRRAAEVTLDNVGVAADAMLGAEGNGLSALDAALDRGAAALCCEAVGAMTALNEITLEYLKTRNQFGRPIGKFQVLQHRMADMVIAEQQARSIALLVVEHANSDDVAQRRQAVSAAKVQIGQSCQIVGRGAIQLHGGIGMTMEYVAGHYFRRLTATEMMFGDQAYHLSRFAAESEAA